MYRNRITSTAAHVLRGVLIFLFFCLGAISLNEMLLSVLDLSDIRDTPGLPEKVFLAMSVYASVFFLFMFYSMARALIASDHRLCMGYVEDVPDHTRKTLAALTRSDAFLLEWGACFVLCLAFSTPTGPFASVFGLLSRLLSAIPFLYAPIVVLVYGLLFGCLLLIAHRSAMKEWDFYHERQHKLLLEPSAFIRLFKRPTGIFCALKKAIIYLYAYSFASYLLWILLLMFFIPVGGMIIREGLVWYVLIILALLILVPIVRRWHRAIRTRRTLVKRFEQVCRERGIEHTPVRHPIRSLWRPEEGTDITFTAGGITYDVKLLSCVNRRARAYFIPGNQMIVRRTLRFFRRDFELFHLDTTHSYTLSGDHKKLVVVCPVAAHMFLAEGGQTREIDTGDRMYSYTIYTSTGFVNALDRDCLPKS
jgi:hypothetical protein